MFNINKGNSNSFTPNTSATNSFSSSYFSSNFTLGANCLKISQLYNYICNRVYFVLSLTEAYRPSTVVN